MTVVLEYISSQPRGVQLATLIRDAPILPENFLENYVGTSKEQNAGKIGGKLEKWAPRNGNLAHFV